jgi:hypothetical protein
MKERTQVHDDLDYIWSVVNSPYKAGNKWCQYKRPTIEQTIECLKRVMVANGYSLKQREEGRE